MKRNFRLPPWATALACLIVTLIVAPGGRAQILSPRRYVRPISPAPAQPARPAQPQPAGTVAPVPPPVPGPTAEDAAKSAVQKQETTKRTVDFLKKRAETGSASAQFDLGKRYLVGDGVETNRVEARKWFEAAAKQEHEGAIARLKQMDAEREKEKEKDALRKLLRPAADSEPAKPEAATGKEK